MKTKLFESADEEKQATLVVAGMFAHSMLGDAQNSVVRQDSATIDRAFDAAIYFMTRAKELLR